MAIRKLASGIRAVFFDLGDTLGTAVLSGAPPELVEFDVFPYVPDIISDLKDRGIKLGIISNTGTTIRATINAVLEPTRLLERFDPELLIYSGDEPPLKDGTAVTKKVTEIFNRAAKRAGTKATPARNLFVGEDAQERQVARAAGWTVCPHPLLIAETLDEQPLRFVRLSIPSDHIGGAWREELKKCAFVPMHVAGPEGSFLYGLTSQRIALLLTDMRFRVEFLGEPDLALTHDLYLLRDDRAETSGFLSASGSAAKVFAAEDKGGHIVSAAPEGLIAAFSPDAVAILDTFHLEGARHGHNLKLVPDPFIWVDVAPASLGHFAFGSDRLTPTTIGAFDDINTDEILDYVERYSGKAPIDGGTGRPIVSRHIHHSDNARVVDQLVNDLVSLGGGQLQVRRHRFTYSGLELFNVEAELAGASPELVLVTAHLDSTAAFNEPYSPSTDPAPGADDDASGMAAVVAIAKWFVEHAGGEPLAKTVRFVLFNAEEQGLVGSQAYARRCKSKGELITAVWQMDMIGYNELPPRAWEAHAGYQPSSPIELQSRILAELIGNVAQRTAPKLLAPQIYHSKTSPNGDPAAGRSDHASFQAQGYPAVVISEDFFIGPGTEAPAPDENPNYHRPGDTVVDAEFAADIARAVGAAAWVTATQTEATFADLKMEQAMTTKRELDTRLQKTTQTKAPPSETLSGGITFRHRTNSLTGSENVVVGTGQTEFDESLISRAMKFARSQPASLGFAPGSPAEFAPDPVIQKTSSGAAAVHLKQLYRGLTVFQMSRVVRFGPSGQLVDAAGDTASIPGDLDTEAKLNIENAVLSMAKHLATTALNETVKDQFGEEAALPTINIDEFQPTVIAGFPLPSRPTVFDKGPFQNPIPVYLLVFNQPDRPRLAWHAVFTFPDYADQYTMMIAADNADGDILYCKSTIHHAMARGRVFEFSPGVSPRQFIDFPRPLSDYPAMPSSPVSGFPVDWVDMNSTVGNSTQATLNFGTQTLKGTQQGNIIEFNPATDTDDDQKLLNIFYFCNYMHDFLFILGFDEASGNFQRLNFTHTGSEGDPVRARAHSGKVTGTANMATGPDGLPPLMNMGSVSIGRHTAMDADVVFHEYVHGLSNRLVGGRLNASALDKLQSGCMGEGWSDYYALTVQGYFRPVEKTVTGDWVTNRPGGIRRAPYDDAYPFTYANLKVSPEVHDGGEVWCAALMMMTRKIRLSLGNDQQGYRLSWRVVTDGLKLTPANPTFLDARDAILRALDDLYSAKQIPVATNAAARRAAWEAFAHFGMGVNAISGDADDVNNIVEDFTMPVGV
ncbi:M28 family peptidase [Rhizobium leguminosarum]|uniref:M20/M25/M40 family metallo-hydrolase n=1 Tax=Rhizobium leguminosarum TaxID=384 RepID=UPI001C9543B1|nr:M20/M25/M40 family metallo-hydrolase [Rhizobium leguminosarum]MBY5408457.1 M28 family peptidase [Rhizobium leguminosarum]